VVVEALAAALGAGIAEVRRPAGARAGVPDGAAARADVLLVQRDVFAAAAAQQGAEAQPFICTV